MLRKAILLLLTLASGCATKAAPDAAALPPLSTFHISAAINITLTPQMMAETGLPASLKGTLEASAESEAVSAPPLTSRHEGQLSIAITDGTGNRSVANVEIEIRGESAGSPSEGLGEVFTRFMNAAALLTKSATQAGQAQ